MDRRLARTDHGYMHLRLSGPATATPPLLLLHQSPSSSRMWIPVMKAVADRLRCVAVDLLGYGDSDPPARQISIEEHAAAIDRVAESVADGPYIVVGHHTGAVIAAQFAAARPDLTAGLLLSGYPLYPTWQAKFDRLGPVLRPTHIGADGDGLEEIWRHVTGPLEDDVDADLRLTIFTDRLRAGRTWFTGYVQLLGADLDAILRGAADPHRPTVALVADRDPLEPFADAVGDVLGVDPTRIAGTSWVTFEHPERIAGPLDELVAAARNRAEGSSDV